MSNSPLYPSPAIFPPSTLTPYPTPPSSVFSRLSQPTTVAKHSEEAAATALRPNQIIREGSFGGSYWRPLFSKRFVITIQDDWRKLPSSLMAGLNVDEYLTSDTYNPEINKYRVACGQSIEEWEAAGWIAHEYNIRGWFQWYCRFWMGRRCFDDERQISRWKKCVDDDGDADDVDASPVVHQTCHRWAYEVRQDALERFWAEGK
ncbi:hypothetical protein QSH57_004762 [Fusarium oxysporum f. sp. vasinfectum]|nr:hypothetical protein QSH57_004762 [Fusarium oxysporum f. sp. vasinfectum]